MLLSVSRQYTTTHPVSLVLRQGIAVNDIIRDIGTQRCMLIAASESADEAEWKQLASYGYDYYDRKEVGGEVKWTRMFGGKRH
jgi:hypothetical protein